MFYYLVAVKANSITCWQYHGSASMRISSPAIATSF